MRGGTHASTYTNLAPHSHRYARNTCKFSSHSDVLIDFLRRNPDLRASARLPPRHSSDGGSPAYLSLVLCLIMSWDDVKPCWFTSWGTVLPGFTRTGRFPLIRVQNLCFYVRAHACEGGHMQATIPTSHHTHTHMLGTHASFHLIPMFSWSSFDETLICAHSNRLPP